MSWRKIDRRSWVNFRWVENYWIVVATTRDFIKSSVFFKSKWQNNVTMTLYVASSNASLAIKSWDFFLFWLQYCKCGRHRIISLRSLIIRHWHKFKWFDTPSQRHFQCLPLENVGIYSLSRHTPYIIIIQMTSWIRLTIFIFSPLRCMRERRS